MSQNQKRKLGAPKKKFGCKRILLSANMKKERVNLLLFWKGIPGATTDFKILAKELKTILGVGGSFKNDTIIIQGDYRERIMEILQTKGFKVKRVGG